MTAERAPGPTLATVVEVLDRAAGQEEPNEEITGLTILGHGLQCAAILRASHPGDDELQVAGLLHDVGHLLAPGNEDAHGVAGARLVRPVLGERVAALIEAHVPAKRYLVTVDASYRQQLSAGSIRTLALQGATMTAAEVAGFRASPIAPDALVLRRADEEAKDPGASVAPLEDWLPVLARLAG